MIIREASRANNRKNILTNEYSKTKPLALFTESIVSLLSSKDIHSAFVDLVSLMGQTFPLSAPALATRLSGNDSRVYTVLGHTMGGDQEARRVLKSNRYSYTSVLIGGHPPLLNKRIDLPILNTAHARITLTINKGIHDEIFKEWVNILTPAVNKIIDNDQLTHLAFRDGLTGLLNYRAFDEMIHAEIERSSRYDTIFSIIMIDIDFFKKVNDTHGHQAGDLVLKSVSQKLLELVRKSDLVFRYGGEEFIIMMPHTGIDKAANIADRIRACIEETGLAEDIRITISIGVSQYKDGLEPADLVKKADMGLYLAKKRGRNRVEIVKDIS